MLKEVRRMNKHNEKLEFSKRFGKCIKESNKDEEYSNWYKKCPGRNQQYIRWDIGMNQQTGRHSNGKVRPNRKKKRRRRRKENSLRDLWENIMYTNIHIIGVPGKREIRGEGIYLKK